MRYENTMMTQANRIAFRTVLEYNVPFYLAVRIRYKNAAGFEYELEQYDDTSVLSSLNACIAEEWGEGVAIVEQEIARRGLHVEDNEGRFEL